MLHSRSAGIVAAWLNHLISAPITLAAPIFIDSRNRAGSVSPRADEPAASYILRQIVEDSGRVGGIERRRLLTVADENDVGMRAGLLICFLGRAHRPIHAFGDLAGVRPAHASIDLGQRSEQVVVVGADFDG